MLQHDELIRVITELVDRLGGHVEIPEVRILAWTPGVEISVYQNEWNRAVCFDVVHKGSENNENG